MAKGAEPTAKREAGSASEGRKNARASTTTPWGRATVVEEARVAQRAGDKRFSSMFQLLESDRGEPLVRIAYTTAGVVRRGPVTLRVRDLERLRGELNSGSALAVALGWSGGEA
jgi:hypothetical protein